MKTLTIIVTYNPGNWLEKCLNSLFESNCKTDVVVIDNGSTDDTLKKMETGFKKVRLIKNQENKGFGAANNQGLKIALQENYDFAFLLNQDAWIQPETLQNLVKVSSENLDYGVLSPIHLNGSGDSVDNSFENFVGPENCDLFSDLLLNKKLNSIYDVPFINAAAWLITKRCLEIVGGFNPSFFHYGEDLNYCERVYYHNLKVGVVSDVYIYHDREEKEDNPYFMDYKKYYKRNLVLRLSSLKRENKFSITSLVVRDTIKHLIALRFRKALNVMQIIFGLPLKKMSKNKRASSSKGPSFLNS